ncbi:hypothetical protein ACHAXT_002858 [Thalassiosira profunda]
MAAPTGPADAAPDGGGDWRASVAQSFRSEQVRSIAKTLADLEPGATSASKTMLALRFEESIFQAASGLDDYRKTIQKRLKKLQKHYAKQQEAGKGEAKDGDDELTREKERLLEAELREEYGPRLLYIARKGDEAIALYRQSEGGDKSADKLKAHVDNAINWGRMIGLQMPGKQALKQQKRNTMADLQKMREYLDSRADNIRSHILKVVDVHRFLQEQLVQLDDALLNEKVTEVFRGALEAADSDNPQFAAEEMRQLLERVNASVPIPRRNDEGGRVRAAVARLEKVRAGVQALYVYLGLPVADKTMFPGCLEKCHSVVVECLKELEGECRHLIKDIEEKDADGKRVVKLEDAWNKAMHFTEMEEDGEAASMDEEDDDKPAAKRQKTEEAPREKAPLAVKTRHLLAPGRNTFSTLLPALKRKRATLVRNRSLSFVKLEFGAAFEMTIYFRPLLVSIRAMANEADSAAATATLAGEHRWPSLYQGLRPTEGKELSVLGVSGSYESLAPIIAKNLEYASAQATYVLRRCFGETTGKSASSEFEVEILEAGALIKFLQMARSTYMPDWVDEDA